MDSFGRFHYLTSYELYKKSSIGVHIGKLALFLYYTINFILLVLPFKIFMLIKNKEPLSLLNKNVVIKFKNRNYFLINIYSKRELDEILQYCKDKNITVEQKTNFIPHWQILPISLIKMKFTAMISAIRKFQKTRLSESLGDFLAWIEERFRPFQRKI